MNKRKYPPGPEIETIERLMKKRDELQTEVDRLRNTTYCAYCGTEFPLDDEAASQVSEHIRICDKHPLRELEKENKHLRKLLRRCDYIFEIYKVNKEDVRDRFDSTLFDELAEEIDD